MHHSTHIDKPVPSGPFARVITDFTNFILRDDTIRITLNCAILESRQNRLENDAVVESLQHLLQLLNEVLFQAPEWTSAEDGLIGCPLNGILRPIMNTASGWALFSRADTNEHLRCILQAWARYLGSDDSSRCLSGSQGWCAPENLKLLAHEAQFDQKSGDFTSIFVCPEPSNPSTLGFRSWDAFFTREFAPGLRPLAGGLDVNSSRVVLYPCEASPYRYTANVKLSDKFWLKSQPYSIMDMLDQHWSASSFQNGSVYQAFLSALSYHRWHSPISGTVLSVKRIPGTYFAQAPSIARAGVDPSPPNLSQAYLASVATRLLILLEADCSDIGMVAFLAIGMAEVSSCQAYVIEGQHVDAGDEIGMFHYGGSSYCLLFQEGCRASFVQDHASGHLQGTKNRPVRSLLALVESDCNI